MPWVEANNQLSAKFKFADFREAFAFMTEVAFAAEELGHHPEWTNVYNTVSIYLSTHDAGNIITEKDHQLASAIDSIYRKY
ncbi:MAG: 4a-hydroxytetrahydrobiopterin dehydratase, partial [Bacteroidota bacterium]